MSRVFLLGVPLDPVTADGAVQRLQDCLGEAKQRHVATPNNEMLVEAHRNPAFHALLCQTDLNLPDSTGLILAARLSGQYLPERVTGVDTMQRLCAALSEEHSVFLLGAAEGVAEEAARCLSKENPGLKIAGTYAGSPREADSTEIIRRINQAAPHLLFVAYGAPAQDMWIAKHLKDLPSVRVAMGVGGAFDFIAGKQKRAPKFLRFLGLEWLWRFVQEPRRWPRMWRAVVVFPWLCMRYGRKHGYIRH